MRGKPITSSKQLLLDVGGVGYEVNVEPGLLNKANQMAEIELFIYTHVKEDKLELYGFGSSQEKDTFKLVLSVSGVGPNIALNLVAMGTNKLIEAVQNAEVSFFTAAPRVGKKLAQKIIIELRGKLGELKSLDLGPKSPQYLEVLEALVALGFNEEKAHTVLQSLEIEEINAQTAIKLAMKKLGE